MSRTLPNASLRRPCLNDSALARNCVRLPKTLRISSSVKMMAAIIHPRLRRGLGTGGGVMTGGGGIGGGVNSGGVGAAPRLGVVSITGAH